MRICSRARIGWFGLGALSLLFGCAPIDTASGSSTDEVTSVENTSVKSQPIGNCWLYATAGWAESLHKAASAQDIDMSEAYWNYWYWYEQFVGGNIADGYSSDDGTVVQGGTWGTAAELIRRYGWMRETEFIAESDPNADRTKDALTYINTSLKSGALADPNSRKDAQLVRSELDKAWKLAPGVVAELQSVFTDGAPALNDGTAVTSTSSALVHASSQLTALSASGDQVVTLADVIGAPVSNTLLRRGLRSGSEAWSEVEYQWTGPRARVERPS